MPAQPKLYLHIGAGKCGSSAIQLALRENHQELRASGVLIPASDLTVAGRVDGHQLSFFENLLPIDDAAIATVTQRLEELRRYVDLEGLRAVVISSENLVNTRQFARLFAEAPRLFNLEVVVYIRRQDDYVVAAWNQWYFKVRGSLEAWLEEVKGSIGNWYRIIGGWEEELPGVAFNVRVFDRRRLVGHDAILDFMDVLEVPTEGLSLTVTPVNRGLNDVAMRIATRNRGLFRDAHDNRFTDFLSSLGGELAHDRGSGGASLSPETRRRMMAAYAAPNEQLRKRHFPELPEGRLFDDDVSDDVSPVDDQDLLIKELDLIWCILFKMYGGWAGKP